MILIIQYQKKIPQVYGIQRKGAYGSENDLILMDMSIKKRVT